MVRLFHCIAVVIMGLMLACTSSNQPSGEPPVSNSQENLRSPSAGSENAEDAGASDVDFTEGEHPVTIMQLAMETGDVFPGRDYYIYAVVDNPDNRDIKYVWSVANGTVTGAPEAEHDRLFELVDDEYGDLISELEEPEPIVPDTKTGLEPGPEPVVTPGPDVTEEVEAPGESQPEEVTTEETETPEGTDTPEVTETTEDPGSTVTTDTGDTEIETTGPQPEEPAVEPNTDETEATEPSNEDEETPAAEETEVPEEKTDGEESGQAFLERYFVGGPGTLESEGTVTVSAEREPQSIAENVVETEVTEDDKLTTDDPGELAGDDSNHDETFSQPLLTGEPTAEDQDEDELPDFDESVEISNLVTDEPFILWEPLAPGPVMIYLKVISGEEDLTEPTEMEVTVRIPDPEVTMDIEFPGKLREEDPLLVKLVGANLTDFHKGLFVVTYDHTKLSLRDAEIGDFFGDALTPSIFYAQPDQDEGLLLAAVDSNAEQGAFTGDGTILYLKFKAKEDLETEEEPDLEMVMDTNSRYILDHEGTNILPLPVTTPAYRSETTMPPVYRGYKRSSVKPAATPTPEEEPEPGEMPEEPAASEPDAA